jgi:hypothetical protein
MVDNFVIFITDDGVPKTGLTPTFIYLHDGTYNVTPPTITEKGGGFYLYSLEVLGGGKLYTGVIDAGNVLESNYDRYIPIVCKFGESIINKNYSVKVAPAYSNATDTATFLTFLTMDGVTVTNLTSAEIKVYGSNNVLKFTLTANAVSENGTFVFTKVNPAFTEGGLYYVVASIIYSGETIISNETMMVIS